MFAAYRSELIPETTPAEAKETDKDWLESKSYTTVPVSEVPKNQNREESELKVYNLISDSDSDFEIVATTSKATSSNKSDCYFVDNKRKHQYLELETLPYKCVAKYKRKFKSFHKRFLPKTKSSNFKRYYKQTKVLKDIFSTDTNEDFKEKIQNYQTYLYSNTKDVEKWIEYYKFQEKMASSTENNEKIKIEVLEKALHYNPNDIKLAKIYLKGIPNVYRSEKVFEVIDEYVDKNPKNADILECLIDSRQNSMVHCNVADVLKLFEKASRNLYSLEDDLIMMKIFKKLALFIRQCGLMEQLFAIIHLVLNINISAASDLDKIFYTTELQKRNLVEYEELVLKSELPMNELFWRIEKLRSICNFLPISTDSLKDQEVGSDPQRLIFKEDIYSLLYPLRNPALKFDLFVLILELMKYPFDRKQSFQNEVLNSTASEIECGMEFLANFLRPNFNANHRFSQVLFGVIRDLNISPNYLSFNIEYESYLNLLVNTIIMCARQFSDKQNIILLVLWIRLERLIIILDKIKEKSDRRERNQEEYNKNKKLVKQRIKKILKQSKFQNNLNIYAEYALIESEFEDHKSCETIFEMALESSDEEIVDYYNIVLSYCDWLIYKKDSKQKALEILSKLPYYPAKPNNFQMGNEETIIRAYNNQIEEISTNNIEIETEDFFKHKNNLFYAIKGLILFILFKKSKKDALQELEDRINKMNRNNCYEKFVKECLYELYISILELKIPSDDGSLVNNKKYLLILENAIKEYPRNIFILHSISSNYNFVLPWYMVKKLFLLKPTIESIFYLILSAKFRSEVDDLENAALNKSICKQRIFNTLNIVMKTKNDPDLQVIQESVLMCRLFLRTTFDYDFNRSKTVLYTSLEKIPYCKSIILDGIIFCPEELTNLLDVVFEKSLRIHTLPEELSVLRQGVQLSGEQGSSLPMETNDCTDKS